MPGILHLLAALFKRHRLSVPDHPLGEHMPVKGTDRKNQIRLTNGEFITLTDREFEIFNIAWASGWKAAKGGSGEQ